MIALDVGEVIVRYNLIVISLDSGDLVAELVDLIAGACDMSLVYSLAVVCIVKFFDMPCFCFIDMIVRILRLVCGLRFAEVCAVITWQRYRCTDVGTLYIYGVKVCTADVLFSILSEG